MLPDGNLIASSALGELNLWDEQGRYIRLLDDGDEEEITSVAVLSADVVLTGRAEGSLTLWNTDDYDHRTTRGHEAAVWALASLSDKRVVAADGDGVLKVWRADLALGLRHAWTCLQTLRGHARAAFCLAALPDGRIVSGSMDRTLRFWAPVGTQIDRAPADV